MTPRTATGALSASYHRNTDPFEFNPLIVEALSPNCPLWVFCSPDDAPQGDLLSQVVHSLNSYGDAVFAAFRYGICHEARAAEHFGCDPPAECDDTPDPSLGDGFPGIGRYLKPPMVITRLRDGGWRLSETFRSCFRTDYLTGELRAYSLSGGKPGGELAARIHLQLISMGAEASNQLVWPAESRPH